MMLLNEYPKMLYQLGGNTLIDGDYFYTCVVDSKKEESAAKKAGWKLTPSICLKEKKKEEYKEEKDDVVD